MACDDFIDTAIYFMVGAAVAATFNTAVDQQIIPAPGARPDALNDLYDGHCPGANALQHLRCFYCGHVCQFSNLCADGIHGLRPYVRSEAFLPLQHDLTAIDTRFRLPFFD